MSPNANRLEDDLVILLSVKYLQMIKQRKKKKKPPRFWVNNYLLNRRSKGRFNVDFPDLVRNPGLFRENFRMSIAQFETIENLIANDVRPKKRSRPFDFISTREKLAVTLEYLASGTMLRHLASCYRISKQHLGSIIESVCAAIISRLKTQCIPEMDQKEWIRNANRFNDRWNFPNCLGAIDGKHCAIKCPKTSGSLFYNYKGFYSIVLLGVADADYKFVYFNVGAHGSEGDSGVFRGSAFGERLYSNKLNIPEPSVVFGKPLPYFFLADDAFPLYKNIMKPYKPQFKSVPLADDERIFNYRLSRARRTVENAFGILCARWMCLARTMFVSPSRAQTIVTACIMLHNYLTVQANHDYVPVGFGDCLLDDGTVIEGSWRKSIPEGSFYNDDNETYTGRPSNRAKAIRDHLKQFLNSDQGSLAWQKQSALYVN